MQLRTQYLLLGSITGLISASLGIGGGGIMIPIMTVFMGFTMKEVVPISLLTIIPITTVALLTHLITDPVNIKWLFVVITAASSTIGSNIGARLHQAIEQRLLSALFTLLLFYTAFKMTGLFSLPGESAAQLPEWSLIFVGIFAGISSALFGIGGGMINVPAFTLLYGLPMHSAVATSIATMIITTLSSIFFHRKLQNLKTDKLPYLFFAALVSSTIGVISSQSLPGSTLRTIFGIFLVIITFRFALNIFKKERVHE